MSHRADWGRKDSQSEVEAVLHAQTRRVSAVQRCDKDQSQGQNCMWSERKIGGLGQGVGVGGLVT